MRSAPPRAARRDGPGGAPGMTDDPQAHALAERARKLFSGPIAFLKSAPSLQFLPDPYVQEIAFCGRSNVGKS